MLRVTASGSSAERVEPGDMARHIARTAARLFAETGYDATSVRMIVEAAGVAKPTLYYHYKSKEALAQALLTVPLTELAEALHAVPEAEADPVTALERLFEVHFAFCREEPDRARFYYAIAFGPLAPGLAEELMRFGPKLDEPILAAIRRLAAAGVVDPDRCDDLLWACRGLITSAVMEHLYSNRAKVKYCHKKTNDLGPELARRLVGDLLRGFGQPGGPGRG